MRLIGTTAFAAVMLTLPAYADGPPCADAATMLSTAKDTYHEVPSVTAVVNGIAIIITVSPEGTWTIFAKHEGQLCAISSGDHWATTDAVPKTIPNSLPLRRPPGAWASQDLVR